MLRTRQRRGAHVSPEPADPLRPRPRPQGRHKRRRESPRLIDLVARVVTSGPPTVAVYAIVPAPGSPDRPAGPEPAVLDGEDATYSGGVPVDGPAGAAEDPSERSGDARGPAAALALG